MKYAIANETVCQKLGAKGIFVDYPFNKKCSKHSIYELKKGDLVYVNTYSWYMGYFWANYDYLKQFDIKLVYMKNDKLYFYDFEKKDVTFNDFLNIKKKNITKVWSDDEDIVEYLKEFYEIDKSGIHITHDGEFKPYIFEPTTIARLKNIFKMYKDKKFEKYILDLLLSSDLTLFISLSSVINEKNSFK